MAKLRRELRERALTLRDELLQGVEDKTDPRFISLQTAVLRQRASDLGNEIAQQTELSRQLLDEMGRALHDDDDNDERARSEAPARASQPTVFIGVPMTNVDESTFNEWKAHVQAIADSLDTVDVKTFALVPGTRMLAPDGEGAGVWVPELDLGFVHPPTETGDDSNEGPVIGRTRRRK